MIRQRLGFVSDRIEDEPTTVNSLFTVIRIFAAHCLLLAFALSWRRAPAQASKHGVRVTISDLALVHFVTCPNATQPVARLSFTFGRKAY